MSVKADQEEIVVDEFHELVNMSAAQLEHWLKTEESLAVGQHKHGASEATGHVSGRAIVKILHHRGKTYTDAELKHMHRTVSYVKRHLAQRPKSKDIEHTRWAASLKNWGHDPEKS
jgi:hypothetical protein